MSATKFTAFFNAGTVDSSGNAARSAGFSETLYALEAIGDSLLAAKINRLLVARAALMPKNVRIVGYRLQTVEPVGASRSFDNVFVGSSTAQNDLPQAAFQWTVRSATTPNQRQLILRGMPDARIVTGEWSPSAAFTAALQTYFGFLTADWRFKAIDRTVLPVKIASITDAGVLTTVTPHGLVLGDKVNIMSTNAGDFGFKSYTAAVVLTGTATTCTIALPGRSEFIRASTGGRARKAGTIFCQFSITGEEVANPTAITRKAGAPFRKFRGRRTAKH